MARKYALLQNNIVVEVRSMEEENLTDCSAYQLIDVDTLAIQPQPGWSLSGNKLVPPTPLIIDADYIKKAKVLPIKSFVDDLMATVIAENIYMGISSAGKSGVVLSFATRQVTINSTEQPTSLVEALMNMTLTVAIEVLDYHIAHPEEYADFAPFISVTRLTNLKNKIQSFLGLPLT